MFSIVKLMHAAQKAERQLGGDYIASMESNIGEVTCIASQVPKLRNMHWRYNFRLNGKVIAKSKLESML